jgi:hypothetical protein
MISIKYKIMKNKDISPSNQESFERNTESNLNDSEFQNLKFNEETNSYELDVSSEENEEYDHPDPYDTTAKNGSDMNSDYDEANPYVGSLEYDKTASLENDLEKLDMHKISEQDLQISKRDELLSQTPEDFRNDLDEEGYPKNDRP